MDSSDEEDWALLEGTLLKLICTKKSFSIHPLNRQRGTYGEFHILYKELRKFPCKFFEYSRMSISTFDYVLQKIESQITKTGTNFNKNPILPCEKLIITIRFLTTGASFTSLGYAFRMGTSTVSNIVKETCRALWENLQPLHIMPQPNKTLFKGVSSDFCEMWSFPNCDFGIMSAKWRILLKPIQLDSSFVEILIKSICALHNTVIYLEGSSTVPSEMEDIEEEIMTQNTNKNFNRVSKRSGRLIDRFREFFCNNKMN